MEGESATRLGKRWRTKGIEGLSENERLSKLICAGVKGKRPKFVVDVSSRGEKDRQGSRPAARRRDKTQEKMVTKVSYADRRIPLGESCKGAGIRLHGKLTPAKRGTRKCLIT